jgi:hypothetical protein
MIAGVNLVACTVIYSIVVFMRRHIGDRVNSADVSARRRRRVTRMVLLLFASLVLFTLPSMLISLVVLISNGACEKLGTLLGAMRCLFVAATSPTTRCTPGICPSTEQQ